MKQGVAALIWAPFGKIIVVSRKNDDEDFGLPGGKVEEGESLEEALIREVKEETGLKVIEMQHFYSGICKNSIAHTFICKVKGTLQSDEPTVLKKANPKVIMNGSFGTYNKKMFKEYYEFINVSTKNWWKNKIKEKL